ncbi:hypothetical protein HTG_04510 [Natrinema mahii]|nr:hypothetical protein HTG_04510 [Natrinema mahii]
MIKHTHETTILKLIGSVWIILVTDSVGEVEGVNHIISVLQGRHDLPFSRSQFKIIKVD